MKKLKEIKAYIHATFDCEILQLIEQLKCKQITDPNQATGDLIFQQNCDASLFFSISKASVQTCSLLMADLADSYIDSDKKESWNMTTEDTSETDVEVIIEMKLQENVILSSDASGIYEIKGKRYKIEESPINQASEFVLHGSVS